MMDSNLVSDWFGERFLELHPFLQQLHKVGGVLSGKVTVKLASGIAGYLGRRLANKLSIPLDPYEQSFSVSISHHADGLHWDRCFNSNPMRSVFLPVGTMKNGYWIETTGIFKLYLTIDIKEGGWYWRCLKVKFSRFGIPRFLMPCIEAYKTIENEKYKFFVGFSLPIVGEVLSYSGLLILAISSNTHYTISK